MVRRATSGQETEQPEGNLVTGMAPSFSEAVGSWVDLRLGNYMRVFSLEHGGSS